MFTFVISFLSGILFLQFFSFLPSRNWVWGILFLAIFVFTITKNKKYARYVRLPIIFALGFAWVLYDVHVQTSWKLPDQLEGKTVVITGQIASIPDVSDHRTAFLFSLKKINNESVHGLVKLSWQQDYQKLSAGDEWKFAARLKKIHGTCNPGGFDYEAFSLHEGVRANGYIVKDVNNILLSSHWYHGTINRIRQFFQEKIQANLPVSNTSPWITALAIGERHNISPENWQVLRNTGTNHLMAIAGLHIGFMSGFVGLFVAGLWRRISKLTLRMPAQHAGAIAALSMALIYSAMAGFSIPTQRACLMLSVFLITLLLRRNISAWHAWSTALFLVLLLNPLSVLTESFWLSFGSVALIIYGVSGRLAPTGLWWTWGRIQWVIAVGLIPLSIWLFQQFSLSSFIANSIAIPCVGFFIVPLTLLGCFTLIFSAKTGGFLLLLADKILGVLWIVLTYFSHLSWSTWYQFVPHTWMLVAACIGVLILLAPIGFPGRYVGLIWCLPLFLYQPAAPKPGEMWLTLLDVGQGLSAVVQTQKHILVFDAGPRLSENFDMGDSVVMPFLHSLNAKQVDMLVVSHGDNDHIGGASAILKQIPVLSVKTSVPDKLPNASYCLRGESWQWDNINFSFLYPTGDRLVLGNDSSCVLRVTNGKQTILLTGDIEKSAEKFLVENAVEELPADIMVAPHHGSKTSGLAKFLNAVKPQYVLFPIGYRNRYHFPNASVVMKYQDLGTIQLDSVHSGAIQFQLAENKITPNSYRLEHQKYWHSIKAE